MYARIEDRDKATTWDSRLAQYDAVCAWGVPDHALLQRVSAIEAPTFVANGDSDPMIRPNYSYLLAGLIPHAAMKLYPDSAHGFLFQHHAEFATDVDTFLGERTEPDHERKWRSWTQPAPGVSGWLATQKRKENSNEGGRDVHDPPAPDDHRYARAVPRGPHRLRARTLEALRQQRRRVPQGAPPRAHRGRRDRGARAASGNACTTTGPIRTTWS